MDRINLNKDALLSYRPHNADLCKPCQKTRKPCLVTFTPLQADIFEGLLDNLATAISNSFIPPAGPLPAVLKVLQNLIVELPLTLSAQADLLAATELAINAYQQSDGWSSAAVASTQVVLTDLYSLSLVACVSSTVKDGWVIRVRLAETNLAGIENFVPPAISGTNLFFDGGNQVMALLFNSRTGLPTEGAIAGTGFVSKSIPVTTSIPTVNTSIVLADNLGGNNYAFSMPRAGTITAMSASFFPNNLVVNGPPITIVAQLCRSLPGSSPYSPFVTIPGTVIQLVPNLSGNVNGIGLGGSLTGLNISLSQEDRVILLFTVTSSANSGADPTTILGTGGGTITIEPVNAPPTSAGPIIPFASHLPLNLNVTTQGEPTTSGIIGFGFSDNQPFQSFGASILVDPQMIKFTSANQGGGTITSVAAYFGVESNQTLEQPVSIFVEVYRYSASTSVATPITVSQFTLPLLQFGTYTTTSPGIHRIVTGLSIPVNDGDRFVMVFTPLSSGPTTGGVIGWASGGISVTPSSG
ncbi:hypothetical protein [Paenibacillus herberti]|uniref:Uncharacterized protein n=1 Tax=Paenibacillus herberti TaxID=1619309 RepID=A0A229P5J4_9BACL|nr:hypothetical protein [Paenibacillus herberti]OXM17224.1 hypothetical protein CGZ75_11625 [Paenibacillus herberti]